jgi:spermidine/putrescine-binding protein
MKDTLLLLNWGEYINPDLLEKFENEFNVVVNMSTTDSNELFYSRVKNGTTVYDLVIPSDYMIEKMVQNDLLQEIDFSKLPFYNKSYLVPGVNTILDSLSPQTTKSGVKDPVDFCVPYFWGTFGIMYDKNKKGLEEIISDPKTAAQNFFNPSILPQGTRIGIYDSPRFIYSAGLQALGKDDLNELPTSGNNLIKDVQNLLINSNIFEWGFDTLKKNIISSNLELGYTWTGDMLDMLYMELDEGKSIDEISFDIVIPEDAIAFMDAFVIPKKARHVDLAHEFINFFLNPYNAYENASTVGYCTPVLEAYNWIINPELAESLGLCDYTEDKEWLDNWSYANNRYYPLNSESDPFNGVALSNFDKKTLDRINQMVNQVKTK